MDRSYTKHDERIQKFRETGDLKHPYKNKLDNICFAYDAACFDSKDLAQRIISDKVLKDRVNEIAESPQFNGYQRALASPVYKFFDKTTGSRASLNEELAEESHKQVIKKFKRRKICARFKDNIWAVDLAEMG